jgi:hypothetical protein
MTVGEGSSSSCGIRTTSLSGKEVECNSTSGCAHARVSENSTASRDSFICIGTRRGNRDDTKDDFLTRAEKFTVKEVAVFDITD